MARRHPPHSTSFSSLPSSLSPLFSRPQATVTMDALAQESNPDKSPSPPPIYDRYVSSPRGWHPPFSLLSRDLAHLSLICIDSFLILATLMSP